jgi:hypothetical protein
MKIKLSFFLRNNLATIFIILFSLALFIGCEINKTKIVVKNGYIGGVWLIKSNVTSNELTLDSNGIGYINEETFNELKYAPSVFEVSGADISIKCVGYSQSAFWARGFGESSESRFKIEYKSFEIVPYNSIGEKQYYHKNLFAIVDTLKLK